MSEEFIGYIYIDGERIEYWWDEKASVGYKWNVHKHCQWGPILRIDIPRTREATRELCIAAHHRYACAEAEQGEPDAEGYFMNPVTDPVYPSFAETEAACIKSGVVVPANA